MTGRLAVLVAAAAVALGAVGPVAAATADQAPHCQHAVIQENSGNGPDYHVLICDALQRSHGEGWFLIVDGGPLQNGAVIFGQRRP